MRDLFRRKEAELSRMEEARRHAGQAICSCAGAQVFCCSGWVHTTCMLAWVKENGRLVTLFKCPHCRTFGCDLEEMEAFRDGEL